MSGMPRLDKDEVVIKKTYRLWMEYLKRSDKYREVVSWFNLQYESNPRLKEVKLNGICNNEYYPSHYYLHVANWDKLLSNDSSPVATLKYNIELGLYCSQWHSALGKLQTKYGEVDLNKLHVTYICFGDVFGDDIDFDQIWERIRKRDPFVLEANKVHFLNEKIILNSIIAGVDSIIDKDLNNILQADRKPTNTEIMDLLRKGLSEYFDKAEILYTATPVLLTSRGNPGKAEAFPEVIENFAAKRNEHLERLQNSIAYSGKDYYFLVPTTTRIKGLDGYLEIYDRRNKSCKKGKKIRYFKIAMDLAYEKYDGKDRIKSEKVLAEAYKKAKKIIENTENGIFPGNY